MVFTSERKQAERVNGSYRHNPRDGGGVVFDFVEHYVKSCRYGLIDIQGRAKLMELSLVTHVPSGPIGCAWAGHFAWQK